MRTPYQIKEFPTSSFIVLLDLGFNIEREAKGFISFVNKGIFILRGDGKGTKLF